MADGEIEGQRVSHVWIDEAGTWGQQWTVGVGDPIDPATAPALCSSCFMRRHDECSAPCDCPVPIHELRVQPVGISPVARAIDEILFERGELQHGGYFSLHSADQVRPYSYGAAPFATRAFPFAVPPVTVEIAVDISRLQWAFYALRILIEGIDKKSRRHLGQQYRRRQLARRRRHHKHGRRGR